MFRVCLAKDETYHTQSEDSTGLLASDDDSALIPLLLEVFDNGFGKDLLTLEKQKTSFEHTKTQWRAQIVESPLEVPLVKSANVMMHHSRHIALNKPLNIAEMLALVYIHSPLQTHS